MYQTFELTLMLNHACNLRCGYCCMGSKQFRPLGEALGERAIDRALASVRRHGTLALSFFGGEPLLEAERMEHFIEYARRHTETSEVRLQPGFTTNGTVTTPAAWSLMMMPEMDLAVSCDGLPEVHDRYRRFANGRGSSDIVCVTIQGLLDAGKDFRAVMTVRPDTVALLPEGVRHLHALGVRHIEPALDLWAHWNSEDTHRLAEAIARLADVWRGGLPEQSISWFDEKAAHLLDLPVAMNAHCGFGCGKVAVAPSGRLYPCERLICEDDPGNPMRLPGHVCEGVNFLHVAPAPARSAEACKFCDISEVCSTTRRCSNYVRTGFVDKPDGLLCLLNKLCVRETARALRERQHVAVGAAG